MILVGYGKKRVLEHFFSLCSSLWGLWLSFKAPCCFPVCCVPIDVIFCTCWMYALCSPCCAIKLIQLSSLGFVPFVIGNLLRNEHWDDHTAFPRFFVTTAEHPGLGRSWTPQSWLVFAGVLGAKMKSWTFLPKGRSHFVWIISAQVVCRENSWAWFSMSSALPPTLYPIKSWADFQMKSIPWLLQAEREGCCGRAMCCHGTVWL